MIKKRSKLLGIEGEENLIQQLPRFINVKTSPEEIPELIIKHAKSFPDIKNAVDPTELDERQAKELILYEQFTNPIAKTDYPKDAPDTVDNLIRCITAEKMTVINAPREVNISLTKTSKFYNTYLDDPEHKVYEPYANPMPLYRRLKVLKDEHTEFIKAYCDSNKGARLKQIQEAFHSRFPNYRVKRRLILRHMYKTKRNLIKKNDNNNRNNTAQISIEQTKNKRYHGIKIKSEHSKFIANLFLNKPGITFRRVRTLLHERFPDLTISKAAIQVHVHRHLKDIFQASVDRFKQISAKRIDQQHIDFVKKLYDERPKMPFQDVYKELTRTFPKLNITADGFRKHMMTHQRELYNNNMGGSSRCKKLCSTHSTFLMDLYQKVPDAKLKHAHQELLKAFPGLSITPRGVGYHLKNKCGIELGNRHKGKKMGKGEGL